MDLSIPNVVKVREACGEESPRKYKTGYSDKELCTLPKGHTTPHRAKSGAHWPNRKRNRNRSMLEVVDAFNEMELEEVLTLANIYMLLYKAQAGSVIERDPEYVTKLHKKLKEELDG